MSSPFVDPCCCNCPIMTGATSEADGKAGLAPAPVSAEVAVPHYLSADGTWQPVPISDVRTITAGASDTTNSDSQAPFPGSSANFNLLGGTYKISWTYLSAGNATGTPVFQQLVDGVGIAAEEFGEIQATNRRISGYGLAALPAGVHTFAAVFRSDTAGETITMSNYYVTIERIGA